jgi:hypothetical protein
MPGFLHLYTQRYDWIERDIPEDDFRLHSSAPQENKQGLQWSEHDAHLAHYTTHDNKQGTSSNTTKKQHEHCHLKRI